VDNDPSTCIETRGEGAYPGDPMTDPKAWWRVSLEKTLNIEGIWIAGGPRKEGVAEYVDVYVSKSTSQEVGPPPGYYANKRRMSEDDYILEDNSDYIVADTDNHRIQRCPVSGGACTTVAGGYKGNNERSLDSPEAVAWHHNGDYVVADTGNHRVQRCPGDGMAVSWGPGECTTVAGVKGQWGTAAHMLDRPVYVRVDTWGDYWISDSQNHRIQRCPADGSAGNSSGNCTRLAGSEPGDSAFQLDYPKGFMMDLRGDLIIADSANHRIQRCPTGAEASAPQAWKGAQPAPLKCTTVAGITGQRGAKPDELDYPADVALDWRYDYIIADASNHRIQKCVADGSNQCSTFVGKTDQSGPELTKLASPNSVMMTEDGNYLIVDRQNNRIQVCPWIGRGDCSTVAGVVNSPGNNAYQLNNPRVVVMATTTSTTTTTPWVPDPENAVLCAENARIGVAGDPLNPPIPISCNGTVRGSSVWVLAKPQGTALRLCEVEIFTAPIPAVTQVKFEFGKGNLSDQVCGAEKVAIDYSDDNHTWLQAWTGSANPALSESQQSARWNWWDRLFSLPFNTTFNAPEEQNVTIPFLRENTTYDVMCWAQDALGNDISQELVALALPWAEARVQESTDAVHYPGAERRLFGDFIEPENQELERLRCNSFVRQFIPCEESVLTSDKISPEFLEQELVQIESTTEAWQLGATQRATWEMRLKDTSCANRMSGPAKCMLRCEVVEMDIQAYASIIGTECIYPRCAEVRWANEYVTELVFGMLFPGKEYTVTCSAHDPWGNPSRQEFRMAIPTTTTPSIAYTTQGWVRPADPSPPPATQPPTTTRRPTPEPAEWWESSPEDNSPSYPPAPTTRPFVYGGGPLPPAPPPDYSHLEQWIRTTPEATTTPAPPGLPTWALGNTELGPLRAELTLAAMTEKDAQELMYPSAVKAIEAALRLALELNDGDTIEVEGMDLIAASGSQRRLANFWKVRVRFIITAVGQVQSREILQRLTTMDSPQSDVQATLTKELSEELYLRGIDVIPMVVGVGALEEGAAWSGSPAPPPAAPAPATGYYQPLASRTAATAKEPPEGSDNAWIIPVVILSSVLCVGLLVGGFIYAVCMAQPEEVPNKKTGKVADASTAVGTRPSEAIATQQVSQVREGLPPEMPSRTSASSASKERRSSSSSRSGREPKERVGRRSIQEIGSRRRPSQSPGNLTSRSTTTQGALTDRSTFTRSSTKSSIADGRISTPVKEAWSPIAEQAGGGSRCSTASGSVKGNQKPSSSNSPASTAREHLVDPSEMITEATEEMELQSCTSARLEVSSPSRLPLHFQSSQVPQDLRSAAREITERPETSGTSNTVD